MKTITASYKKSFIEAVKLANKQLHTYLNEKLSLNDYSYTNSYGFGGDNSLKMDLIAENFFVDILNSFGNIYSEECGFLDNSSSFTIIIDPLDGSNNFYSQLPYYGTSIALQKDGITIAGFVTNLITGIITYRAFEDEIKYFSLLQNKEINILEIQSNKIAIFERAYEYPNICEKLNQYKIKFRCLGAVALSLSDSFKYDFVLYAGKIRDFDVLAALYICKDLYIYKSENFLFITKNKEKYDLLKEVINQF